MTQEFAQLLKRLEAATVRLEGLSSSAPTGPTASGANAGKPVAASGAVSSPSLEAFGQILTGPLQQFADLSKKIGGVVDEQVSNLNRHIQ
jgi:hypothetical protein